MKLSAKRTSISFLIFMLLSLIPNMGWTQSDLDESVAKAKLLSHAALMFKHYETPYLLKLKKGKKELKLIGSKHSNNPEDSLFAIIDTLFKKAAPQFVFNEGGEFKIYESKDSTIRLSWEAGYLIYLCKESAVPRKSIEPAPSLEFDFLLQAFSAEDVFFFYAYRNALQLARQKKQWTNLKRDEKFSHFLSRLGKDLNSIDSSFVYLHDRDLFQKIYKARYDHDFDYHRLSAAEISPLYFNSILNQINRALGDFRDYYMIDQIKSSLSIYDRVFIVLGASHVLRQEAFWRQYFKA